MKNLRAHSKAILTVVYTALARRNNKSAQDTKRLQRKGLIEEKDYQRQKRCLNLSMIKAFLHL